MLRLRRRGPEPDIAPAPPAAWCHAPSTALYFAPDGSVLPCCAGRVPMGWMTGPERASLRDVWHGAQLRRLRAAVAVGDLSLGCDDCALAADGGGREVALAVQFDRWADPPSEWPRDLEFALSNTCNLQCVMCNGDLSSAVRAQREHRAPLAPAYDDRFFAELAEFLPHARRIAFKGGEPFLAREARRVMDLLLEQGSTAEVKVTTNGTVWSERVERFARGLRMSPILSVDAMDPDLLRRLRVGVDVDEFWRNVDRFAAVVAETGAGLTLSYCLMRSNWQELAPVLRAADRRGAWIHVSHVTQPAEHTLLGAGPELDDVLAAMRRQGDELELANQSLRHAWDMALDWVRYCRDASTPVADPRPARSASRASAPGEPDAAVVVTEPAPDASMVADLRAWAGVEPLVFTAPGGRIAAVTAPPWAEPWHPARWAGSTIVELPGLLATSLGRELSVVITRDGPGGTVAVLVDPAGRELVRAVTHGHGGEQTVYLAAAPGTVSGA